MTHTALPAVHWRMFWLIVVAVCCFGAGSSAVNAESSELHLTILHTNDEHSALIPVPLLDYAPRQVNPALGGYARLAAWVEHIRAEKAAAGEPVLLISAADWLGGSPYAWLALEGMAAELSLMHSIGYDVTTIGNHEYDYGPEQLAAYLQAAGYPEAHARTAIVASNTHPPADHPLGQIGLKRAYVKELENGLRVGFLGLIGQDAIAAAPLAEPVTFSDQKDAAIEATAELQQAGVHLIVAITHAGIEEDKALAAAVPAIDVVVGGHCHTVLTEPMVTADTIIVQAGEQLRQAGILELAVNPETGAVRIRSEERDQPFIQLLDHTIPTDEQTAAMVQAYTDALSTRITDLSGGRFSDIADTVVWSDFSVTNHPPLAESPFGNFVADAMRLGAAEAVGEPVHLALQANGLIRGSMEPGTRPWSKGRVSFFDLAHLVGLGSGPDGTPGYPLISIYLTGEELLRVFELQVLLAELMGNTYFLQISGARITYDPNRAILLTVPFLNIPIPTARAVMRAELYAGSGVQFEEDYIPIKRGDAKLYHVVADYYVAQFLPMVGDMLPSLALVLKDNDGLPIEDIDDAIIYRDGQEYKVWQAVMEFAGSQPLSAAGYPYVPEYYRTAAGRLVTVNTVPLLLWPLLGFLSFLAVIVTVIVIYRRRRRAEQWLKHR